MWRSFVVLGALGGCYKPSPPEGAPCNQASECPAPLMCIAGACSSGSGTMMIDAPADTPVGPDAFGMLVPSNGIVPVFPSGNANISISGVANVNVDTGHITGSFTRIAGTGIINGIGYAQTDYMGVPLAVFTFHSLAIAQTATVQLGGSRAVAFIVEKDMTMAGTIDGAGGCGGSSRPCAGPGGGTGGTYGTAATGCGIGLHGSHDLPTGADTGGGGGGGGTDGASGGVETASSTMFPGGMPGTACIPATLEPLVGGSGGGGGGPGAVTPLTSGGGGGGAFQLTCLGNLTISGSISMGGAGGDGGTPDPATTNPNGGAGGGGGGGGGILVEGLTVIVGGTLAANGGAGGGGSAQANSGTPGQNAIVGATAAAGGVGGGNAGIGGNGGTGTIAPTVGQSSTDVNAGAGGGGAGVIVIRALAPTVSGTVSPPPMILAPHSQ